MTKEQYWFGFKQTVPSPPGIAVACGPYSSYEEAKIARERAKAWDCAVSTPFIAASKEEADKKAAQLT